MRGFFSRHIPAFRSVLLIESGSRAVLEELIPGIYKHHGADAVVDVVTCYSGQPESLKPHGRVYRVTDYGSGSEGREKLLGELRKNNYETVGVLCTAEPIMTKWKWWLAWKLPAKAFIVNENGDYFWIDRGHLNLISHFMLFRLGMAGAGFVPTLVRLAMLPLSMLFLAGYAGFHHLRRAMRGANS